MWFKMAFVLAFVSLISVIHAAPLARRMVDLTYTFDETTLHFPTIKKFDINTIIIPEDSFFPGNPWIQSDEYSSSTHAGTHMDAPRHFVKGGKAIDELDIEHFIAPAAVVDISAKAELDPDSTVSVEDLTHWESVTGQSLDGAVLLVRTGWGKKWGNRTAYYGTPEESDVTQLHYPGISGEAAQWLVDNRNIVGVGIDTLSIDNGASVEFLAHQTLLGRGIFALENVARLEDIPIYGAELHVMPMKIGGGSGAPTRVIAIYPEVVFPLPNV